MSPSYLANPIPSRLRAPAGAVFLLHCDWTSGNVGVGIAPAADVGPADYLHAPDRSVGLCRLPDVLRWDELDQLVRNVVTPLMGCVLAGCETGSNGYTFTPEAETAKQVIARAVATWRDGVERQP